MAGQPYTTVSTEWTPPHVPFLKFNSNSTIFNDGESVCYGLIVRNVEGVFNGSKLGRLSSHTSIIEAEALSVHETLSWLKDVGYSQVIIEMDCLVVFYALFNFDDVHSYFSAIIRGCKELSSQFSSYVFNLVSRQSNCMAHLITCLVHFDKITGV